MARMTAEERASATTVLISGDGEPILDDVEQAFDDWRTSFENAAEPGKIQAYQVPMDERGAVQLTSKSQVRLGSWPVDLYSFDELCAMIIRDWMIPAREKIMAVRLLGTKPGKRGFEFNKIVILRPGNSPSESVPAAGPDISVLMRAMQEMNERTMLMMQRLTERPPAPPVDPMASFAQMLALAQQLNSPMTTMMQALLPALAGRPVAAAGDPFSGLTGILDVAERLSDMRGGGDSGGANDSDLVSIIKSIVPLAKPALEAIPSIMAAQPLQAARPKPVVMSPQGQPVPVRQIPQRPPITPTPKTAAPPASGMTMADLPSGDTEMFAQLKPQIDSLCQMAAQGSDSMAAADLLFDSVLIDLPDALYEKVCELISRPAFVGQAALFNPDVNTHKEFFEKFRAQIVKRIEEEDAQAGMQPTSTGE